MYGEPLCITLGIFFRCMDRLTNLKKPLLDLAMTLDYVRLKAFFDLIMHIAKINYFVKGVKKSPRADCSKLDSKTTQFFVIFQVFLGFWPHYLIITLKNVCEY